MDKNGSREFTGESRPIIPIIQKLNNIITAFSTVSDCISYIQYVTVDLWYMLGKYYCKSKYRTN